MSRLLFAALAAGSLFYGAAVQAQEYDPLQWLERMYSASKHLSYSGTFLYQHGDQIETSRITRLVDQSGVHERLETLDGIPREIVRDNDEVTCYLPRSMTVKIDNRRETSPLKTSPNITMSAKAVSIALPDMRPSPSRCNRVTTCVTVIASGRKWNPVCC